MKKHEIFFGENGITTTSANYIANKANEYISTIETELKNTHFVNKTIKSIMKDSDLVGTIVQIGLTEDGTHALVEKIRNVANVTSLIAWLREGIKAKEDMLKEVKRLRVTEWADMFNVTLPKQPIQGIVMTEDDYIGTLSVKERNAYFEAETKAAVIGKLIHDKTSAVSLARQELANRMVNPIDVQGEGQNTMIYQYVPSVNAETVDKIFFGLQSEYRSAQAEVNSVKYKMKKAIDENKAKVYADWEKEYNIYAADQTKCDEAYREYQRTESARIGDLKIIIPNDLQETYDFINNL